MPYDDQSVIEIDDILKGVDREIRHIDDGRRNAQQAARWTSGGRIR